MINILPQPRQMFEFAARPSYFRITTCSCDFVAQMFERNENEYFTSNLNTTLKHKGNSICQISIFS